MASPRVFISSTCYDLADERDSLSEFCDTFGFDTTLSERGDVFYHPDMHTHTSCIRETSNCHLFVLIIGGRFGGKYKVDPTRSITNAEYAAAIQNGTPVFTFVKQDVLNDHNVWQRNKKQPFAKQIEYPSIDVQEHAEEIFKFIDSVRQAPVNNGIFGFRLGREIQELLRKQWASMMFDYLQNRTITKQISITNDALGNLAVVSGKIEELVKNIYRNVDAVGANSAIATIDHESLAEEFLASMSNKLKDKKFIRESSHSWTTNQLPSTWWEFLDQCGFCEIKTEISPDGIQTKTLHNIGDQMVQKFSGRLTKDDEIAIQSFQSGYERLLKLTPEARQRLASKYFWTKEDSDRANARAAEHQAELARKKENEAQGEVHP